MNEASTLLTSTFKQRIKAQEGRTLVVNPNNSVARNVDVSRKLIAVNVVPPKEAS